MSFNKNGKFRSWILRMVKGKLLKFANQVLIPKLQEKVNAGAIDEQVDGIIEIVILDTINQL